ncbi:SPOUT methyltransferase, predicted [Trema orientale]|uniref:SPOUT methyltransferase, predicted n=1 Tax=Trema orientale TaxID=63057 RepID=A0A2P5G197_TREOI|nr:SPOUT methyltransferase, predicted [Trema orientale]
MAVSVSASFPTNISAPSSSGSYALETLKLTLDLYSAHFLEPDILARLCQASRALPIRILWVGKKRSRGVQLVFDEYIEKLKLYCNVNDVQIRSNPKNARDWRVQVEDEDNSVMNLIRSNDWVVLLDERGQDMGSAEMAELLGDAGNTGASGLSFCIGGPYGHGQRLRERANLCIKLSSMVFNHQIALLVLVEQLYRLIFLVAIWAGQDGISLILLHLFDWHTLLRYREVGQLMAFCAVLVNNLNFACEVQT